MINYLLHDESDSRVDVVEGDRVIKYGGKE